MEAYCLMLDGETDIFDRLYPTLEAAISATRCYIIGRDFRHQMRIVKCKENPTTGQREKIGREWLYTIKSLR